MSTPDRPLDDIKARIRALMARTVASGCTEAEALAAAEKVMEMMRKHGLQPEQVQCSRNKVDLRRSRKAPIDQVLGSIGATCRCEVWFETGGGAPIKVVFFGRDPWPEVATWLQGTLFAAHERALKAFLHTPEYRRRRAPRTKALARRHFTEGFVSVLARRLYEMRQPDLDAVRADRDIARRALEAEAITFKPSKAIAPAKGGTQFMDARTRGHGAGGSVNLAWGLNGGGPRALLTGDGT